MWTNRGGKPKLLPAQHWPLANGEESLRQQSLLVERGLVDEDAVGSDYTRS